MYQTNGFAASDLPALDHQVFC